ncbi:GntR family transcriptional regulator [Achromobacter sp. K91]|uniref:GntR family transcriptional regulator n=1 Tax=Achromobacter sp. K91 TaxID=2292262 RepID=UPI000E668B18|nr:GntR family transcriptional regulator [Achromobacter sp. K91]RIJ05193.1 GntR family transcriptional regulator [Achromobacter sp. K91]
MNTSFPNPLLRYSIVETALVREIAAGRWPPGTRIPGENALIRQFNVSRSTVRRAVQHLAHRGLVTVHRGKGTYVVAAAAPA